MSASPAPPTPQGALPRPPNESTEERRQHHRNLNLVLTIVRHGATDYSAHPRVLQGQFDTQLNDKGRKQSLSLAHRLQKQKFNHIYSSDLVRANETAQLLHIRMPDVSFTSNSRLREQNLGDLEQKPWAAAKKMLKTLDLTMEEYLVSHPPAETTEKFSERVVHMYTDIVEKHLLAPNRIPLPRQEENLLSLTPVPPSPMTPLVPRTFEFPSPITTENTDVTTPHTIKRKSQTRTYRVLIVTHGGVIQQLLKHVIEELGFEVNDRIRPGYPKHTGIYQLKISKVWYANGDYDWVGTVNRVNCVSHLAGLRNFQLVRLNRSENKLHSSSSLSSLPLTSIKADKSESNEKVDKAKKLDKMSKTDKKEKMEKAEKEKAEKAKKPEISKKKKEATVEKIKLSGLSRSRSLDQFPGAENVGQMVLQRISKTKNRAEPELDQNDIKGIGKSSSQTSLAGKKSAGMKFFGSLLSHYQSGSATAHVPPAGNVPPRSEEKRGKSLGW